MSELGPDAQALVRAGRGSLGPSAADRERIARGLRERLGTGFEGSGGGAPAPSNAASGLAWKGLALVGTVIAVGGAVVALSLGNRAASVTPAPPPAVAAAPDVAPVRAEATQAPPAPVDGTASSTPVEALPVEPRAAAARRSSSRLAEEVSILSRAETELHAGRPASALQLLEEHRRKFPGGALAQERIAARIHALCALGRTSEAESELARLKRVSPGSPQEGRARAACAPGTKR
jgi:hypothetical protein